MGRGWNRAAKVKDAVSWGVVGAHSGDNIASAIATMLGHNISGIPVLADDRSIVGILTEGDLVRRIELGTERKRSGWRAFFVAPGAAAEEYTRSNGRRVGEVMTRDVACIDLSADLVDAVDVMEDRNVKRLPVTDHGKLVGMLSRTDILRVLARALGQHGAKVARTDEDIASEVKRAIRDLPFATSDIEVSVSAGAVRLSGTVLDERERLAIRVAAENVAGVSAVEDELCWVDPLTIASAY